MEKNTTSMLKYYIVDAFTEQPFGGNTAGVVLLDRLEFPDEGLMLRIAAELRYSETAFVRREDEGVWHLRYFTPRAEVELCGHATVGAVAVLHAEGLAEGACRVRTKAGELQVIAAPQVMMQMAPAVTVGTIEDPTALYEAIGVRNYTPGIPVQVVSTGLPDIMLPLPDVDTLQSLHPDMAAIATLTCRHNAVSFHPFAIGDGTHTAHVRDFAPAYGVPEESATGTANAALTHYLATNGIIGPGSHSFLQGEAMGHPSVVATWLQADGSIMVGGSAAIVAEGHFRI